MPAIQRQKLVRLFEAQGAQAGTDAMLEHLENKEMKLEELSIRDLWEATVFDDKGRPCGKDLLYEMDPRRGTMDARKISVLETRGAIDTTAFANITGPFIYNTVKEAYDDPEFIGDKFFTVRPTDFMDGEKIPGVGMLGDQAQIVKEGEDFPVFGTNEEWSLAPPTQKRGYRVQLTREIIQADKTGLVVMRAQGVGRSLGINKEKRQLDCVFGITNTYNRNGTASDTFRTSGPYVNNQVNALSDWTSLQTSRLLFAAINDPNTGEPILALIKVLAVPQALEDTANRIIHATSVEHVDNTAGPNTIRTTSPNPVRGQPEVITSPYIDRRTSSTTTWFTGDPKRAFIYQQNWEIETLEAAKNSEADFNRDVVQQHKCSERGVCHTIEPRYWQKNTAS